MRIAHVSDIHIRNLRYHDEYQAVFDNLCDRLSRIGHLNLIVNTGDTAHLKTAISPEFVWLASQHFRDISSIAPYHVILGNHDLNLRNPNRRDAISPLVEQMGRVHLHTRSGMVYQTTIDMRLGPMVKFWNYSICDEPGWPQHGDFDPTDVNIGLFHGSIRGCQTDQDFVMTSAEQDIGRFDGLDFLMMGDIHRRQSFWGGRAWYAGSLIQQNFGEDNEKGFLLWDIQGKDEWSVEFIPVKGARGFATVQVPANLELPDVDVSGMRIRAIVDTELSLSERRLLEDRLRSRYRPHDVVTVITKEQQSCHSSIRDDIASIPQVEVLRQFLRSEGKDEATIDQIIALDDRFRAEFNEDVRRNVTWRLDKLLWSNLFNYGEGNHIDLARLSGVVGIFAPNTSGKSSIFEVLLETLFDKISKDVPRNIDLINDNRDRASMVAQLTVGDEVYLVERTIDRLKGKDAKEWGRTSLDFHHDGECLNGDTRPETEKKIRSVVGSFDDFVMTSMVTQRTIAGVPGGADIINCKETDRKRILFRYLDLDTFEQRLGLVKEEIKKRQNWLKESDPSQIALDIEEGKRSEFCLEASIEEVEHRIIDLEEDITSIRAKRVRLNAAEVREYIDPDELQEKMDELIRQQRELEVRLDLAVGERMSWETMATGLEVAIDLRPQIEGLRGYISTLTKSEVQLTAREDRARAGLKLVQDVPCQGSFPHCKFLVQAIEEGERLDEVVAALATLSDRIASEKQRLSSLERSADVSGNLNRARKSEEVARANLAVVIERISAVEIELDRARQTNEERLVALARHQQAEAMSAELSDLEAELSDARKELEQAKIRLAAVQGEILRRQGMLQTHRRLLEELSLYEALARALGKDGIPHTILTRMLPTINGQIDQILSRAVNFKVVLEHDQAEGNIGLKLRYGDYKSRPIGLASGAEKFIAALAIRTALLSVSSLPKTNFMVVDEGFGSLDPEHLEALQRLFNYLKTVFDTIFVVSHVDALKDIVDQNIEISTTDDGYASVRV